MYHSLAFLHGNIVAGCKLIEAGDDVSRQIGPRAKMHGECRAFVFEKEARVLGNIQAQGRARVIHDLRRCVMLGAIGKADFGAMQAHACIMEWRKNAVQIAQAAPTDKGQRTMTAQMQMREQFGEIKIGAHIIGVRLKVDKCAVDVKEKSACVDVKMQGAHSGG